MQLVNNWSTIGQYHLRKNAFVSVVEDRGLPLAIAGMDLNIHRENTVNEVLWLKKKETDITINQNHGKLTT
jgi:hypothetical protein